MIARIWSADTTRTQAPVYADHLKAEVLPVLKTIDGYAGAMLLQRETGKTVEVIVLTWWHSLDAVRRFAGADLETAVVADEAAALLTRFDLKVRHYDLIVQENLVIRPIQSSPSS